MPEPGRLASVLHPARDRLLTVAFQHGRVRDLGYFESRLRAWHAAFRAAPGQRYILHFQDSLEFAAALFGIWHAGKCALVPSGLQAASWQYGGFAADGCAGSEDGLVAGEPHDGPLATLGTEAVLLEMYTSGTTGAPLSIPKRLRELEQELEALASSVPFPPPDVRVLGTVSHQHMYGLVFRVLLPLVTGRPFEAQRLASVHDLPSVNVPQGCVLVSSPAQLTRLPPPRSSRCPVRAVLSAGGSLSEEGAQACRDAFGIDPFEIYGSSETGAVAWRRRTPAVTGGWRALPGVELREVDGLLHIRCRQLPSDEWFRSADRVLSTPQGFELAGRADRVVKLEERRVSLDSVEAALLGTGLVSRVRALVVAERRPVLGIIATPTAEGWNLAARGKRALVVELLARLREGRNLEVLPRSWRFVDPWPITADGKSPETLLRERFDRRNPEFRVIESAASSCTVELWVPPVAPYFVGHFPGQPVLAGVVQIEWLVWLCRVVLGIQAQFAGLEAAKFRRVIVPGNRLQVVLQHGEDAGRTSYRILRNTQPCASGRILWRSAA